MRSADLTARRSPVEVHQFVNVLLSAKRAEDATFVLFREAQLALAEGYVGLCSLLCDDLLKLDPSAEALALKAAAVEIIGENPLAPPLGAGDSRVSKVRAFIRRLEVVHTSAAQNQLASLYRRIGEVATANEIVRRKIADIEERIAGKPTHSDLGGLAFDYWHVGDSERATQAWRESALLFLRIGHVLAATAQLDMPSLLAGQRESPQSHTLWGIALHDPFQPQPERAHREFRQALAASVLADGPLVAHLSAVINSPLSDHAAVDLLRGFLLIPPENDGCLRPRCVSCGNESAPVYGRGAGLCSECTPRLARIAAARFFTAFG